MTARAVRSPRQRATETYQASTLDAHIRHCLPPVERELWEQVKVEYQRATGRTSTIGLLSALAALALDDLCRMADHAR